MLWNRHPGQRAEAGAHRADRQVLPHPDAGHEGGAGRQPLRAGRHRQDRVGQGPGRPLRPAGPRLQLRRGDRRQVHGEDLHRADQERRLGLLRRVQPAGGADPVRRLHADPADPDGAEEQAGWQFNRLEPVLGPVFGPLFGPIIGPFFVLLN